VLYEQYFALRGDPFGLTLKRMRMAQPPWFYLLLATACGSGSTSGAPNPGPDETGDEACPTCDTIVEPGGERFWCGYTSNDPDTDCVE
jgi:hypothetical protein